MNNFGFANTQFNSNDKDIQLTPDNLTNLYDLNIPERLPHVKENQIKEIDGAWILAQITAIRDIFSNLPRYNLPPLLNSYQLKDLDENTVKAMKEIWDHDETIRDMFFSNNNNDNKIEEKQQQQQQQQQQQPQQSQLPPPPPPPPSTSSPPPPPPPSPPVVLMQH